MCLTQKREIKVSQNAKFSQNREIMVSRNTRTSKSRKFHVIRYFMRDQLVPDSLIQFRNMYWLDWPKLKHIVEKAILNNYSISLYRDSFIAFIFLVFNTLFREVLVTGITYFAKVRCLRAMRTCTSDRLHADSQWDHSIFYPKNSRITYDRNA